MQAEDGQPGPLLGAADVDDPPARWPARCGVAVHDLERPEKAEPDKRRWPATASGTGGHRLGLHFRLPGQLDGDHRLGQTLQLQGTDRPECESAPGADEACEEAAGQDLAAPRRVAESLGYHHRRAEVVVAVADR